MPISNALLLIFLAKLPTLDDLAHAEESASVCHSADYDKDLLGSSRDAEVLRTYLGLVAQGSFARLGLPYHVTAAAEPRTSHLRGALDLRILGFAESEKEAVAKAIASELGNDFTVHLEAPASDGMTHVVYSLNARGEITIAVLHYPEATRSGPHLHIQPRKGVKLGPILRHVRKKLLDRELAEQAARAAQPSPTTPSPQTQGRDTMSPANEARDQKAAKDAIDKAIDKAIENQGSETILQ